MLPLRQRGEKIHLCMHAALILTSILEHFCSSLSDAAVFMRVCRSWNRLLSQPVNNNPFIFNMLHRAVRLSYSSSLYASSPALHHTGCSMPLALQEQPIYLLRDVLLGSGDHGDDDDQSAWALHQHMLQPAMKILPAHVLVGVAWCKIAAAVSVFRVSRRCGGAADDLLDIVPDVDASYDVVLNENRAPLLFPRHHHCHFVALRGCALPDLTSLRVNVCSGDSVRSFNLIGRMSEEGDDHEDDAGDAGTEKGERFNSIWSLDDVFAVLREAHAHGRLSDDERNDEDVLLTSRIEVLMLRQARDKKIQSTAAVSEMGAVPPVVQLQAFVFCSAEADLINVIVPSLSLLERRNSNVSRRGPMSVM